MSAERRTLPPASIRPPDTSDPKLTLLEMQITELGEVIREQVDPDTGFAIFLFDRGKGGHVTYGSNANRADFLKMLGEFLISQLAKDGKA